VARALGTLPRLAEALARGEISYAKVRAVTRVATPETEERLLPVARAGTAEHVERIVRGWRRVDRQAEIRETARHDATRALHVYPDDDGTVVVRGRLTPEAGALLLRALDAARETLYQQARGTGAAGAVQNVSAETPTFPQQQADALALLAETSQRLACDASRVVMREDAEGRLVEIGARTRTIPPAIRRALHRRDGGCRFPGCGIRIAEGHHIRHGLSLRAHTMTPGWLGERLDVGWAIDVLHPLARDTVGGSVIGNGTFG